jgi:type VI secretion system secreted protein Hcp
MKLKNLVVFIGVMFALLISSLMASDIDARAIDDGVSQFSADSYAAQSDFFLKLDGIEGESMDDAHKGEIEIESFNWDESNAASDGSGGGGGAGKVSMQDFHFTARSSKATPLLMQAVATGEHIKKAVLTLERSSGEDDFRYLVITMEDVMISQYGIGGSGEVPADTFSITFGKILFEHFQQKPDGSAGDVIARGWDLKQNKKI